MAVTVEAWSGTPDDSFADFWYAMLAECDLLGSGAVPDWRERLNAHFRREHEAGRAQWIVARDGERIVATAAAFLRAGDISIDRTATLAGVYVLPEYRRGGIARRMTLEAISWCKAAGCKTIRLQASPAGRPLYEELGFQAGPEMFLTL